MRDEPHITYTPHTDTTPEQARDARVRALRFVFDCHAKKNTTSVSTATDAARLTNKERRLA